MIKSRFILGSVIALTASLALTGCGSSSQESPPSVASATPADDILGQVACQDFRVMISDVHKGILTDPDIRTRVQAIYKNGQYAQTKVIADASTTLLAADTTGDTSAVTLAVKAMDLACSTINE